MILGRVTGHLWATRKCPQLVAQKLAIVRPDRVYRYPADHVVAIDTLGADVGETVLVCLGAPARWCMGDEQVPVDAAVAAIVDRVEESR
jgi:microcompartment protein CcmK/EutM